MWPLCRKAPCCAPARGKPLLRSGRQKCQKCIVPSLISSLHTPVITLNAIQALSLVIPVTLKESVGVATGDAWRAESVPQRRRGVAMDPRRGGKWPRGLQSGNRAGGVEKAMRNNCDASRAGVGSELPAACSGQLCAPARTSPGGGISYRSKAELGPPGNKSGHSPVSVTQDVSDVTHLCENLSLSAPRCQFS